MAGTKAGGQKAAARNKANNPNFYKEIGAKGGRNGHTGGFASKSYEFNSACGKKGGTISRRKPKII